MHPFQLAAGGILLLVECLLVLKLILVIIRGRAATLVRIAYYQVKACVSEAVGGYEAGAGDAEIDTQAKALMTKRSVRGAELLLRSMAVFAFIRTPLLLRDLQSTGTVFGFNSKAGTLAIVALIVLSCSTVWASRLLQPATLPIWYLAFMSTMCVAVSPAAGAELSAAIVLHIVFHLATALISLICIGPFLVTTGNLCFCVCIIATFTGFSGENPGLAYQYTVPAQDILPRRRPRDAHQHAKMPHARNVVAP